MKKIIFTLIILTTMLSLPGCGKNKQAHTENDFLSPTNFTEAPEDSGEDTAFLTAPDIFDTPTPTPEPTEEPYFEIVDENGIVSDMCDIDMTEPFLQFNNCEELYGQLPMYAFNILRDSTTAYLDQAELDDATILTYVDDSLEITETHVNFVCQIKEYPEYELYFTYSIEGAYYDYAILIR